MGNIPIDGPGGRDGYDRFGFPEQDSLAWQQTTEQVVPIVSAMIQSTGSGRTGHSYSKIQTGVWALGTSLSITAYGYSLINPIAGKLVGSAGSLMTTVSGVSLSGLTE